MTALRIQLRRDTAANWVSNNPILLSGELGIETDTLKFKIGNGSRWNTITSYALKLGEANGIATLNALGKISTSQLPDSMSVSADLAAAIAALTTNSISEGTTNKYFTNQRAIDAVSASIATAIATEVTNRNTAIATAKTEAINTASTDATNKASAAQSAAVTAAAAAADTKDTISSASAVAAANSYTDGKIVTEVSNRSSAINTAISTEITNRNTAINAAVSAIPSGGSSTITLGTVSTGNPGTSVSITNTGTATAPLFNFTIPRGDVGPQGLKGDTGAAGATGSAGTTGSAGATGAKGDTGATGLQGLTGAAGATGDEGPRGLLGIQGIQGLKGDTGLTGAAGATGTNGLSPTVTVGTTTTVAAGSLASVINSGTTSEAVLNFTIPRGADGTGGSGFTGTSDSVTEGTTNLYFTNERASLANNQRFTDVYVNINAATDEILAYTANNYVTITNLDNRLDGYVMEADADLGGGYAKIGVTSGKILDSVIPTTIARTSDIASQIATVVNGAPATFDTLKEIADYIATDQTAASSLTTLVGTKLSSATAASTYAPIASPTFTGTVAGITKTMVGLGNVDNTTDALKPISSATQTALDAKLTTSVAAFTYAPLASPTFTGTVTIPTKTVKSSDLAWDVYSSVSDLPQVYVAGNHGMFAHVHSTASAYFAHTNGWKQILDTALAASIYAPLVSPTFTGTVNFSNATVTGLSTLPTQIGNTGKYLTTNGTTASWATITLPQYSIIASPTFSGTVDFSGSTVVGITATVADSSITSAKIVTEAVTSTKIAALAVTEAKIADGSVTSAKIVDGTIVNADINTSAEISKTKIAGTAVTLADTASVTNAMLANSFVGINGNAVYLGQVITIPVGAKTFYNNTGTLPTSGMVAGDIYIQY